MKRYYVYLNDKPYNGSYCIVYGDKIELINNTFIITDKEEIQFVGSTNCFFIKTT